MYDEHVERRLNVTVRECDTRHEGVDNFMDYVKDTFLSIDGKFDKLHSKINWIGVLLITNLVAIIVNLVTK